MHFQSMGPNQVKAASPKTDTWLPSYHLCPTICLLCEPGRHTLSSTAQTTASRKVTQDRINETENSS